MMREKGTETETEREKKKRNNLLCLRYLFENYMERYEIYDVIR